MLARLAIPIQSVCLWTVVLSLGLCNSTARGQAASPESPGGETAQPVTQATAQPPAQAENREELWKKVSFPRTFHLALNVEEPKKGIITWWKAVPRGEIPRIREALAAVFDRYPPGVIERYVNYIYVVSEGEHLLPTGEKYQYGGCIILGGMIILTTLPRTGDLTADLTTVFDHEFSSALFQNYKLREHLDEAAFVGANPEGFVYDMDRPGVDPDWTMKRTFTYGQTRPSLEEMADGFFTTRARLSLEEDFNYYAQYLMWRPRAMLGLFDEDSAVGRKLRVVRDFYLAVDPRFAEHFDKQDVPETPQAQKAQGVNTPAETYPDKK